MKKVRKIRVYLDTSVISALFDETSPEMMYWTHEFWKIIDEFEVFISNVVITEIQEIIDNTLKMKMLNAVKNFKMLDFDEETEWLSNEYVRYGAVPGRYSRDAFHIGIATVNQMDILISWNYKHIVRRKTREIVKMVNVLYGYPIIEIITPPEIIGGE